MQAIRRTDDVEPPAARTTRWWWMTYGAITVSMAAAGTAIDHAVAGAATEAQHAVLTWSTVTAVIAVLVAAVGIGRLAARARGGGHDAITTRHRGARLLAAAGLVYGLVRGPGQVAAVVAHVRSDADEPLTTVEGAVRIAVTALVTGLLLVAALHESRSR